MWSNGLSDRNVTWHCWHRARGWLCGRTELPNFCAEFCRRCCIYFILIAFLYGFSQSVECARLTTCAAISVVFFRTNCDHMRLIFVYLGYKRTGIIWTQSCPDIAYCQASPVKYRNKWKQTWRSVRLQRTLSPNFYRAMHIYMHVVLARYCYRKSAVRPSIRVCDSVTLR